VINKRFDLVEKTDVDALVSNQSIEKKTLEYKEFLAGSSDSDKKEFLADVSSFANASGGDILFGIQEQRDNVGKTTGIPAAANGLANTNSDLEIRRLESMIRDGIAPRIAGVQIKPIEGFANGPVLLLRVPKSWAAPHMVLFRNDFRFYSRNSAGKYQLDITEIRSAFALSEALPERIQRFRDGRLAQIIAGETPVIISDSPKIVLHVLPVSSFDSNVHVDLRAILEQRPELQPIYASGSNTRYNFDGILLSTNRTASATDSGYVQVFRSGAIESVTTDLLGRIDKLIPSLIFERELILALDRYLRFEKNIGNNPPIVIMLSILGVKGHIMATRRLVFPDEARAIDRDNLLLPDILVEDYSQLACRLLHPAFDAIWQAAGWSRSGNYDDEGVWIGQ